MKTKQFFLYLLVTVIMMIMFTACVPVATSTPELLSPVDDVIGMANPSAVYCEGLGYETESVERNGGMDADCIFPDDSRCPQWDFLAGRCGQQYTYCAAQGHTLESSDANIGTCRFADESSCGEYAYFMGECSPGTTPAVIDDSAAPIVAGGEIQGNAQALEYLVAYLSYQFDLDMSGTWTEQNINDPDSGGVTTFRYVNGPYSIVLSWEASAPWPNMYTIREASNIATGFYWEGTLSYTGQVTETKVILPSTILNEAQARDAVLAFLKNTYGITIDGSWVDEGTSQTGNNTTERVYTSGSWSVDVEFAPAAPLVAKYSVTVETSAGTTRWNGEITSHGDITETSFTQ